MITSLENQTATILRDLGDGLVLRRSRRADAEALAAFNAMIHSDDGPDKPDDRVGVWTRDLLLTDHPTFGEEDYTIVEDTKTGKIVSSLNLISQTWTYAGIPFGVGRPELVGTLPEYRKRGLVRQQFEVVHEWSAQRGERLQVITGIPFYYRQFGYEMALNLAGGRSGPPSNFPPLKEGESEPYRIRPAVEADLPFIAGLYEQGTRRGLVSCVWDDALWRYELLGKSYRNVNRYELRVTETPEGEPLGYFAHPFFTWGSIMPAIFFELKEGVSYAMVAPSVMRYLVATGEEYIKAQGKGEQLGLVGFYLGEEHPAYAVMHERLPRIRQPYAYYLRLPDLVGFLKLVQPALEERLRLSAVSGHSGELKLSFYRDGVRLVLEKGRLSTIEVYQPDPYGHSGDALFPGMTFLQVLFGYRSIDELRHAYPDCIIDNDSAYALVNALFPKQASDIWPVA